MINHIVTGASGLLGSEIMKLSPNSIGISSRDCDLRESAWAVENIASQMGIKSVIHCAAKVGGVKSNSENLAGYFDENVSINMNVLKACKESGSKLVSVLSTCIYPDAQHVKYPLTEDQLHSGPPHQSNFGYAYAKRMLEVQSRAYRLQYGCNFISVIPNNLYGPNDNYDLDNSHVVPALIRKFHEAVKQGKDEVVVWGTGRPMREFTFARDAARIILWLSENYDGPEPINIGNPEQVSIENLAIMIGEEIGYEGRIRFDTLKPDGQYEKPSSNQRLRDIGWDHSYTPLRVGIRETVSHFRREYPNVRGV